MLYTSVNKKFFKIGLGILCLSGSLWAAGFTEMSISLPGLEYSSVAWGDYDSDGDLDILLTGYSYGNIYSRIYRNNGSDSFTDMSGSISLTAVYKSSVAWGDYDNDGDLDILLTGYPSPNNQFSKIYRNNGSDNFTDMSGSIPLTGVYESSVAWGDYDNDGDLDILLTGNKGDASEYSGIYRNDGSDSFTEMTDISLTGVRKSNVAWGDYDNDGDLDILLTGYAGLPRISKIYRNNGSDSFTEMTGISLTGVSSSSVAWGDYDNDGDLDILLTGYSGYDGTFSKIYRNDGSDSFTDMSSSISLTDVENSSVAWGDYDNDGDLDILLTGNSSAGKVSKIYRNDGSDSFTDMSANISLTGVDKSSVAWGDYDNDGDLDILLTGSVENGITKIYRNDVVTANVIPNLPANLAVSVFNSDVTLSWDKSTDTETNQDALTYNIYLGTSSGGNQTSSPMANISNGYRRLPALGNTNHDTSWTIQGLADNTTYYWSVQAVDNAFAGSAFATENSFEFDSPTVSTASVSQITEISAKGGGEVTDEGLSSVTSKGVVWSTSTDPTVDSNSGKTDDGSGLGTYVSELTDLTQGTTYYVRAYATNSVGIAYGVNKRFVPIDIPGNALDFDGSDDYINCGNDALVQISGSAITLEAWINVASFAANSWENSIIDKHITPNLGYGLRCGGSGIASFNLGDGSGWQEVVSPDNALTTGQWQHIAATYDGSTQKLYVDGVLVTSNTVSFSISANTSTNLYLGDSDYYSGRLFSGKMDEVRIWNTTRTITEIQANMHGVLNGDEANLLAYYTFDHSSGTTLIDIAGSNDGTLTNMTNGDWITSFIPVGDSGVFVNTTSQTTVGDAGKQLKTTITKGRNDIDYLGIYRTGDGTGTIDEGETFPAGVVQRSNIFWGIAEYGLVTADLVIDYSNISGFSNTSTNKLLKRTNVSAVWTDVTSSFTHDTNARTFTATGVSSFSEFSIGSTEKLPTVATEGVSNITWYSASSGGTVSDEGSVSVTARGVCWSTSTDPTTADKTTSDGSGAGSYTSSLSGLSSEQTYYVRAYATNAAGTSYGENESFTTSTTSPGHTLDFDGSDDYVNCGNDASLQISGSAITLEAWVNATAFAGASWGNSILDKAGDEKGYLLRCGGAGVASFNLGGNGWHEIVSPDNALSTGKWHHIAGTYDGTTQKLYVDGIQVNSATTSFSITANTSNNLYLGESAAYSSRLFNGKIDEVRIWADVRSASEIQNNMYNVLNGDETNLISYYQFDHTSGTSLSDRAGSNDGTLTNMTDDDWLTSLVPVGDVGTFVNTTTQTTVGDVGKQLKATITSGGDNTNYLGIYRTGAGTDTISSGETFPAGVVQRSNIFWGIAEYGLVTADLVIDYSNISGFSNTSTNKLLKRTNVSAAWTDVTSSFTHDIDNRTFTGTGQISFSEFSIADGGEESPVPIKLSSFTANTDQKNAITLKWVTESEIENLGFIIEKHITADNDWIQIASYLNNDALIGHGSTTESHTYQYVDDTVQSGVTYAYRLGDVDYSSNIIWHDEIEITMEAEDLEIPVEFGLQKVYPNPFNPAVTLSYGLTKDAHTTLLIYNMRGQLVETLQNGNISAGNHSITWQPVNIASGVYIVRLQSGNNINLQKIAYVK